MKNDAIASGEIATTSRLAQIVYLTAGFQTLFLPLGIIWWRSLPYWVRGLVGLGAVGYALPFAATGTFQGFAYLLILGAVGYQVLRARSGNSGRNSRRRVLALIGVAGAFLVWTAFQSGRAEAYGEENLSSGLIAELFGTKAGLAWDSATFYPTHGYRGLAEAAEQPFVFTGGYGSSKALNRYAWSYFGLEDKSGSTYIARTEYATGYPAGMLWHTVYPWLASDLTFPGAVVVVGLVGLATARLWRSSVRDLDSLSIGLLGYAAIFIAFIPANNQVLAIQSNVIGLATLVFMAVARGVYRSVRLVPAFPNRPPSRGRVGTRSID